MSRGDEAAVSPARSSLWRHRDFVKLWSGETISVLGTQVTLLAIPLVALKLLGATTFEVGLLASVERLPFLLFGLPAGALVDRLRRRPVLVGGDLGRALLLASVPLAYWAGDLSMLQLYVVVFLVGVLTVFFDVAYQSYLPALVDRDRLVDGNAKLQVSESGAQIAGPAFAGFFYDVLGAGAIVADAISYVCSALCVLWIRAEEVAPSRPVDEDGRRIPLRAQIAEGWHYVVQHRYLRSIAACTAISNLFAAMFMAVFLTYAVRVLHLSAGVIGLVFAVGSVGFLVGAVAAQPLARRLGIGRTIVWSAFLWGPPGFAVPLAPGHGALPWLAGSLFATSFCVTVYNIVQVSLRQSICPARLQGRMNATMRFIVWGIAPVGAALGGLLGSDALLGLRPTLFVACTGLLVCFVPVLLSPVRVLAGIPEGEARPSAVG